MSLPCVVTRDLDAYLAEQDRAERLEQAIQAVQDELTEQYEAEELAARMKLGDRDNRINVKYVINESLDDLPDHIADALLSDDLIAFAKHFRELYIDDVTHDAQWAADRRAEQDAERELDARIRSDEEDAAAAAYDSRMDDTE